MCVFPSYFDHDAFMHHPINARTCTGRLWREVMHNYIVTFVLIII